LELVKQQSALHTYLDSQEDEAHHDCKEHRLCQLPFEDEVVPPAVLGGALRQEVELGEEVGGGQDGGAGDT
jgi:hypothetical protein